MIAFQQFLLAFMVFGAVSVIAGRSTFQSSSGVGTTIDKSNVPKGPLPIAKPMNQEDTRVPAWWDLQSLLTPRLFTNVKPKSGSTKTEASTTKMPALTSAREATRSKITSTQTTTDMNKLITTQPDEHLLKSTASTTSTPPKSSTTMESTSSTVQAKVKQGTTSQPAGTQTKSTSSQKYQSQSDESTTVRLSTVNDQSPTTLPKPSRPIVSQSEIDRTTTIDPKELTTTSTTQQPTTSSVESQTTASLQETSPSTIDRPVVNSQTEMSSGDGVSRAQWSARIESRYSQRKPGRGHSRENFDRRSKKRRRNRNHRHRNNYERRLLKKIKKACRLLQDYKLPKKPRRRWVEDKNKAVKKFFAFLQKTSREQQSAGPKMRHKSRRKYIVDELFKILDHEEDGVIKKHEFETVLEMLYIIKPRSPRSVLPNIRVEAIRPGR